MMMMMKTRGKKGLRRLIDGREVGGIEKGGKEA